MTSLLHALRKAPVAPSSRSSDDSDTHMTCDIGGDAPEHGCCDAAGGATAGGATRAPWHPHPVKRTKSHDAAPDAAELEGLVAEARAALEGGGGAAAGVVDRQLVAGGEEGVTSVQLQRWLRARGWDPARAARDLASHAAWRAAFAPLGRVQEAEVAREIGQSKVFLQGPDHKGRGVTIFIGGNHTPRVDPTECHRFIYYAIDATIAAADLAINPLGKTAGVLCMKDFGWRNFDVMGGINIARAVHHHYVERLDQLFIHGTSAAFQRAYRLVEPFIDPITRRKIVLLPGDEGEARAILAAEIGTEFLPPFLGGTAEPRPIEAAWAQMLPRWSAAHSAAKRAAGLEAAPEPASALAMCAAAPAGCGGNNADVSDDDDDAEGAEFFDFPSEEEGGGDDEGPGSPATAAAAAPR